MIRHNVNSICLGAAMVAVVAALAMLTGHVWAQAPMPVQDAPQPQPDRPQVPPQRPQAQPPRPQPALQVGTYDPEVAFQAHPKHEELMSALATAQTQLQEAQEEADQQQMQQVVQRFEQVRDRITQQFQQDVTRVLPEVAEAAGVKIVAMQIIYQADDVRTTDITPHLARAFADDDDEDDDTDSPAAGPQFPPLQR